MAGADVKNKKRFVSYDENFIEELLLPKTSKNTDNSTKSAVTLLKIFCAETSSTEVDIDTISYEELDKLLIRFYAGARKANGDLYKLNTMKGFRFSLQRYFQKNRNVNILDSTVFNNSNCCFKNVLKSIKKAGKGDTDHYPEIEPEDLKKLYQSFDTNTPTGLQEKVWFDIMFQLIRRGRQNLRAMTKDTFIINKDASGKRYIQQNKSELDKNHDITDDSFDTTGEGRIYETGGQNCPVRSFIKYVTLLHPFHPALWQRPRDFTTSSDLIWYCCSPLGEKSLGDMMSKMSAKYNLSERYTNHSIRVTSLQLLDDENIEGRHIIRVSGHKSVDSVQNYARRLSAARKRNISSVLSNHVDDTNICQDSVVVPSTSDCDSHEYQRSLTLPSSSMSCSMKHSTKTSPESTTNVQTTQNLVDFNVEDSAEDETLRAIPPSLLMGMDHVFKPLFVNCKDCHFTFNINMK